MQSGALGKCLTPGHQLAALFGPQVSRGRAQLLGRIKARKITVESTYTSSPPPASHGFDPQPLLSLTRLSGGSNGPWLGQNFANCKAPGRCEASRDFSGLAYVLRATTGTAPGTPSPGLLSPGPSSVSVTTAWSSTRLTVCLALAVPSRSPRAISSTPMALVTPWLLGLSLQSSLSLSQTYLLLPV